MNDMEREYRKSILNAAFAAGRTAFYIRANKYCSELEDRIIRKAKKEGSAE